jgi:hypothetical protein
MNRKINSLLFVIAAITTSTAAFAAGPCTHLRYPGECVSYPTGECYWDESDQRCENRSNNEDACSRIRDSYACSYSSYGCFWDNDDQRCERRN